MEGGNREEEDLRLGPELASTTVATSPKSPYSSHHLHKQLSPSQLSPSRHQQRQAHRNYPVDSYSPTESHHAVLRAPPTDVSVAAYAAKNLEVVTGNAAVSPAAAFGYPLNPDDFYRSYRGVQSANTALLPSPIQETMASAVSINHHQAASPRSNGHGPVTSRLPAVPGSRVGARHVFRSVSNPVDDRLAGSDGPRTRSATGNGVPGGANGRSSVKDMKKKFEQNVSQPSPVEPRRAASRSTQNVAASNGVNGRTVVGGSGQSYSALRTTGTEPTRGTPSRSTQRTKFMAEDQLSSNSQSFASRINRPRMAGATGVQSSKSMTHLSHKASLGPQSSPPPPTRTAGLLFGEILPDEVDEVTAGYGIENVRPRRPSESTTQNPSWHHKRSLSDAVAEPASPTNWYRDVPLSQANGNQSTAPRMPITHVRSRSDVAGSIPPPINTNLTHRKAGDNPLSPHSHSSTSPGSRIPISVKRLSNSPNHASPASTRSNSPATAAGRRPAHAGRPSGRSSRQQVASASRAKTPSSRSNTPVTRSKTPTRSATAPGTRRPGPSNPPSIPNSNSSRLASVITPTPKLSPPLRSSRPRQPVSTATTASSRLKAVDRSKSPHKVPTRPPSRPASRQDAAPSRRRKLSMGPVDFAERRETIKLKYSKSIRETEARQAREAAAERRRKEMEAAARAKTKAQAQAEAQAAVALAAAEKATSASKVKDVAKSSEETVAQEAHAVVDEPHEPPVPPGPPGPPKPKTTTTQTISVHGAPPPLTIDSPTLGIPGTFPSFGSPPLNKEEAPPPSAISETSAVTEFDNEAQTEPAVHEQLAAPAVVATESRPAPVNITPALEQVPRPSLVYEKATYRDPFEEDIAEDEGVPVKISLNLSLPQHESQTTPTPHDPEHELEPDIPGAFRDDHEIRSEHESRQCLEPRPEAEPDTEPEHPPEPEPEEYEPQPYVPLQYQTTTVTILSRDKNGFIPPSYDKPKPNAEELPVVGADAGQEPPLDSLEQFYTGPHLKGHIPALRDSTFTISEADTEPQRTPDTSNSLNVPAMLLPANRSSQQSVWTDFSIDSTDGHGYSYRDSIPRQMEYTDGQRSRPESFRDDASFWSRPRSHEISPSDAEFRRSEHYQMHSDHHHLPELDTGDGFSVSVPYIANAVPDLPDHAPPPPPSDHSRPPSGYYDDARPSSSLNRDEYGSVSFPISRRESDDYPHTLSTPQSLDGVSVGADSATPAQTPVDGEHKAGDATERPGPTGKEKSRLTQRSHVIKELVDTEAVFVRDMSVVEEIYKGTAEACPKLDDKTIKLIFRNSHEIIAFHTTFLGELKDGVTSVYIPKGRRSPMLKEETTTMSDATTVHSAASTVASAVASTAASSTTTVSTAGMATINVEPDFVRDRQTSIGPAFIKNIEKMKIAHEGFLRTSDLANKRLIEIQQDPTVQVWLNECNEVAKDLTAAWNLDSLLIKPMQRITKYPNLISQLLQYTPADHPDRENLIAARTTLENAILEINKTKKNFELVGQIVGRKRKESDVKAGFARAFGKRVDKLQASSNRPPEDPEYLKFNEKFSDDYLRLQVVLRDVEFYTRQVTAYVHEFLQYLSSIELVMRLQPGPYPELESKWVQFNVSMRDIEKVALEQHLQQVRKYVIEPFEQVIRSYQNPLTAMKKRSKRRLDFERSEQLKKSGKKVDKQLAEFVEQYEALNDTLKKELPKLSACTEKVGNMCLANFIQIQTRWYGMWKEKVRVVLGDAPVPEFSDITTTFHRDFKDMEDQMLNIGILNPTLKSRVSQSTTDESMLSRSRSRPSDIGIPRGRGLSVNSDQAPVLPPPDFGKRHSGQFTVSPSNAMPSPNHLYYRDYYSGINARGPASPMQADFSSSVRPMAPIARPSTGRSFDNSGAPRPSTESAPAVHIRKNSNPVNTGTPSGSETRRFSGLFHSALPMADATEESQRSSRASSRERHHSKGYNVLWLAASLFEFNIETTKHEAGYPYLTYQAGEIFDVIAEKGELWLAKNQDDPTELVGWIWSKHFAKLADS